MKAVHVNKENEAKDNLQGTARDLEKAGSLEKAAAVYERLVKLKPHDETAYNRLMILYRKLNDPAKELQVIKKGIATFEKIFKRPSAFDSKVVRLSKALQKATGLVDAKGKHVYEPEPLGRWRKRHKVVEKKLER